MEREEIHTNGTMRLNRDVLGHVFSFLPREDWFNVMCTCKLWNEIGRRVFDPSTCGNALMFAVYSGNLSCLKMLLKDSRVDPSIHENSAIRAACEHGNVEAVKELLQDSRVDPSADDNYAIGWASRGGHVEVVRLLLNDKRVDPTRSRAFDWACDGQHLEVVKLLIRDKRVDPTPHIHRVLRMSCESGDMEAVQELISDGRMAPRVALEFVRRSGQMKSVKKK
jgi:ankyrin repeat protein